MRHKRLFSGIQPTGELHLGNYFGAITNWVRLQDQWDAIYCVVDYHAMTVEYDSDTMRRRVLEVSALLIACGLDPAKCSLFVQSDVPEHTELMWVLSTLAPMGRLQNMTQFKEKSEKNADNINLGLFAYPVLQAADILIYKAEAVPVGEDQLQHLELSRELARKFNTRFGETFPEPKQLMTEAPRILGLDGKSKMSKSLNNYIGLTETPEQVWEKLRPAYTDPARLRKSDPGNPDICNIFTLHKMVSPKELVLEIDRACRKAEIGCIECKKNLAQNLNNVLDPIRSRYSELEARPGEVLDVLAAGKERCRRTARETMDEVREKTGLRP
ncbi:MAG TPA: tryptophan--tRNA ligase [Candidatus Latescibacteria bacterium]|nr:tryptophan--tRNA ligase [Candidatus Latescibacterota bacterium]